MCGRKSNKRHALNPPGVLTRPAGQKNGRAVLAYDSFATFAAMFQHFIISDGIIIRSGAHT
jgi:hypothetical protein